MLGKKSKHRAKKPMSPAARAAASRKRVDAARRLSPADFNVWKHYEDRADQLGGELWTIGSWLSAIVGATLALPFAAEFITANARAPYLHLPNRAGVGVVAAFGLFFCFYSYSALSDVREHIESNWRKAGFVLEGTWQSDWAGRKGHGWKALLAIGWFAILAFATMVLAAFLWPP